MADWKHYIAIKHLITEEEDHKSIQASMNAIADVLDKDVWFSNFSDKIKFRKIPKGNRVIACVDYANRLMDKMYDYADKKRIWVG